MKQKSDKQIDTINKAKIEEAGTTDIPDLESEESAIQRRNSKEKDKKF